MSGFKGTPGPWRVDPSHCGDVQTIDGQWEVACTSPLVLNGGECPDEWRANARLIAAAPELLEACQTFAEWLRREEEGLPGGIVRGTPEGERQWRIWWEENLRICNLAQQQVRAAIAKATGEQP